MKAFQWIALSIVFYTPSALSGSLPLNPHHWAGFHTGLILGTQSGHSHDKTAEFGYNADNDEWYYHQSGVNAGVELGYSYLWHQFVIGSEIELGYLSMEGSGAQPDSPGPDTIGKSSSDIYTTIRARLGVDINHYLLFATGGAIGTNHTNEIVDGCNIAPCGGSTVYAQKKNFVWGYTAGAGIEHWFEKGWSAKLECLYFNLNSQPFSGITNLGNRYEWTGNALGYIIRAGLNYHF